MRGTDIEISSCFTRMPTNAHECAINNNYCNDQKEDR